MVRCICCDRCSSGFREMLSLAPCLFKVNSVAMSSCNRCYSHSLLRGCWIGRGCSAMSVDQGAPQAREGKRLLFCELVIDARIENEVEPSWTRMLNLHVKSCEESDRSWPWKKFNASTLFCILVWFKRKEISRWLCCMCVSDAQKIYFVFAARGPKGWPRAFFQLRFLHFLIISNLQLDFEKSKSMLKEAGWIILFEGSMLCSYFSIQEFTKYGVFS